MGPFTLQLTSMNSRVRETKTMQCTFDVEDKCQKSFYLLVTCETFTESEQTYNYMYKTIYFRELSLWMYRGFFFVLFFSKHGIAYLILEKHQKNKENNGNWYDDLTQMQNQQLCDSWFGE